jgi:hypothetical protein
MILNKGGKLSSAYFLSYLELVASFRNAVQQKFMTLFLKGYLTGIKQNLVQLAFKHSKQHMSNSVKSRNPYEDSGIYS